MGGEGGEEEGEKEEEARMMGGHDGFIQMVILLTAICPNDSNKQGNSHKPVTVIIVINSVSIGIDNHNYAITTI